MTSRSTAEASDAGCRERRKVARELAAALDETDNGTSMLRAVVIALIGRARQGDVSAIREIFDRIDGKAEANAAARDHGEPKTVTFRWMTEAESKATSA
jgi:hypothetical protein